MFRKTIKSYISDIRLYKYINIYFSRYKDIKKKITQTAANKPVKNRLFMTKTHQYLEFYEN